MTITFDSAAAAQSPFDAPVPLAAVRAPRAGKRVLLVSDDAQLRALLSALLDAHGYDAVGAAGAAPSRPLAADWDAAIVDAALPHGAVRWLCALEALPRVPTIALAAGGGRSDARPLWNRVDAVLQGPLAARKLVLIMRGLFAGRREAASRADAALTAGPVVLRPLLNLAAVETREVVLTDVETRVLRELMLAAGTPVARHRLVRCGLGRAWSPHDRCLDTHIKRLRRKLGPDARGRTPIRTVRGVGYLLLERWQPAS